MEPVDPTPRAPLRLERRRFIALVSGGLLVAPLAAEGQKPEKMARVGILGVGPAPGQQELARSVATNPFWQSMRQLGWVEGQNLIVERRFGESTDQLRAGAAELVRLKPVVLFVAGAGLAKILQSETRTIPIVVGRAEGDLVAAGLVESLARPGGMMTGVSNLTYTVQRKTDLTAANWVTFGTATSPTTNFAYTNFLPQTNRSFFRISYP